MKGRMKFSMMVLAVAISAGCSDRYDEGYWAGYAAALAEAQPTTDGLKAALDQCETAKGDAYSTGAGNILRSVTTQVCGGGGVTLNGNHVRPGKTGCVRVFSDGSVERY